jgi:hypothetical protein
MRLTGWLHRRCRRELELERERFMQWKRESKAHWGAKNKRIEEQANQRVSDARAELAQRERLEALLTATPRGEECEKVRLNDRGHAEAMVAHVLETAGVRTEPYPCPVCPRQLFGRGKFWHVRTINDPEEKARRDAMRNGRARPSPSRLGARLDPEQVQAMRERTRRDP